MPRGTPFQPGNKFGKGRPPGSRNKSTLLKQGALDRYAELLINKCVLMATNGSIGAMRICMDRVQPRRHSAPVHVRMPLINTAADVKEGGKQVMHAVAKGKITPLAGQQMMAMLELQRRAIESDEFAQRLEKVEASMNAGDHRRAA